MVWPVTQPAASDTSSFGASSSTATDQDGVFRFRGLEPGSYTVVVDAGNQFEKAREPVVIDNESRGRLVQVAIQLHLKVDAANPATATGGSGTSVPVSPALSLCERDDCDIMAFIMASDCAFSMTSPSSWKSAKARS